MDLAVQLLVALGLASCAGLRAWLPLLIVSLLAQNGYLELNQAFAFLGRQDAVIIFAVATVLEILGDKVVAVDHFLDAVGTVVRPAAGAVLASAMFVSLDPLVAVIFGLIVGGSTAFTVNAGKAIARAKATALSPLHGGLGNTAMSVGEDLVAAGTLWLIAVSPWLAALVASTLIVGSVWLVLAFVRAGGHLVAWLRSRVRPATRAAV